MKAELTEHGQHEVQYRQSSMEEASSVAKYLPFSALWPTWHGPARYHVLIGMKMIKRVGGFLWSQK